MRFWLWSLVVGCCVISAGCKKDGGSAADGDGDGFEAPEDCDDSSAEVYPGADEICDGVDNDCNGLPDFCGSVAFDPAMPVLDRPVEAVWDQSTGDPSLLEATYTWSLGNDLNGWRTISDVTGPVLDLTQHAEPYDSVQVSVDVIRRHFITSPSPLPLCSPRPPCTSLLGLAHLKAG